MLENALDDIALLVDRSLPVEMDLGNSTAACLANTIGQAPLCAARGATVLDAGAYDELSVGGAVISGLRIEDALAHAAFEPVHQAVVLEP